MTKFIEYIGAMAIAAAPALTAITGYLNPSREALLRPSADPSAMVWSYPGEYRHRNFKDVKPFGSLDEVVLMAKDGTVATLRRGDKGFEEQETAYSRAVGPYLKSHQQQER